MRDAVRAQRPDGAVWPELFNYAADWIREDRDGGDGVMNYVWRDAILDYLSGAISARLAGTALDAVADGYGLGPTLRSWTMLGSHDVERILTRLEGDTRAVQDRPDPAVHPSRHPSDLLWRRERDDRWL